MCLQAAEKVLEYNRANREVAILCNHQRTVPKAFAAAWEKLTLKENLLKTQLDELQAMLPKAKKGDKVKLKSAEAEASKAASVTEGKAEAAELAKQLAAEEAHLFTKQPTYDEVQKRVVVSCSAAIT
jgi:DNA topoisomerase-1